MQPASVGTLVRVIRNEHNHSYRVGGVYTVSRVDDDGTFQAAGEDGRPGNWLRWTDCEPAGFEVWSRIAADLPEPILRFLACFDGIGTITLKEPVIDAVLATLPDLEERIAAFADTPAGAALTARNRPQIEGETNGSRSRNQ